MRLHVTLIGCAVLAFVGWLLLWPRETSPDLVRARDRLLNGGPVTVTFDPGGVAGYRFIALPREGWLWERTTASGVPYPDAFVFDGEQYLLRVAGACYIRVRAVPPLVPGLTASRRLSQQPGLQDLPGDRYSYVISPAFAARPDVPVLADQLEVTEDLSRLREDGVVSATTGSGVGFLWRGDYTLRRSTTEEVATARAALAEARPSDYAELTIRERVVGNVIGTIPSGTASVVVAEDCPTNPARLWPGALGGQVEGLRITPVAFDLTSGDAPVIRDAHATAMAFFAPAPFFNDLMADLTYGDVPVTTTSTIIINRGAADGVVIQVVSCTSRPWFRC